MIAKTLLAAIAAGLFAGVLMTGVQQLRLVPLIVHAEAYEGGGHAHAAVAARALPVRPGEAPRRAAAAGDDNDRLFEVDRYAGSLMANLVVGAGYGLLLAAVALLTGRAISLRNGVLWGAGAWVAVHLMPALGLPPELPGMPMADLTARQIWWVSTVLSSGAGVYLLAFGRGSLAKALGIALLAAPQVVGAPQPDSLDSMLPAVLAAEFAASALATALFFWLVLGLGVGALMDRVAASEEASQGVA